MLTKCDVFTLKNALQTIWQPGLSAPPDALAIIDWDLAYPVWNSWCCHRLLADECELWLWR